MAYLMQSDNYDPDNEKNKTQGYDQQNNPLVNVGSSGVVSGSSNSTPVSTAGVGAGGLGSWTNIQSYLNANKQDTGTSDYVNKQIGDQFDKEKSNLDNSVNESKSKADSALSSQYNWDQANQMMKSLVPSYQWTNSKEDPYSSYNPDMINPNINGKYNPGGGTIKGDYSKPSFGDYGDVLSKLKSAANNSFSGPNNFSYSLGQNAQNFNNSLKDDNSFGNYLQNTYRERSGTPLTSGQLSLQKQLDTTNDSLAQARQNLLKQYSGLESYKDNAITDTNNYLQNKESTYRTNQNLLRDNFQNEQEKYNTENQKQIADAMGAYGDVEKRYREAPPKYLTPAQIDQSKNIIFQARKYKGRDARTGWNIINEILGNPERKKQWISSKTGEDFD